MRNKTREAMRLFLGGRCYTAEKLEKDYLAEVANYSNDRWEAPQRAARLAASVKRYRGLKPNGAETYAKKLTI
ncbi:hypothetical protein DRW92_23875 [Salmonella enterica subsp. enterica serovar Anatum]|nr:hypothetical protein [Salmonella enterica subsp. enterica serovar Anatum]